MSWTEMIPPWIYTAETWQIWMHFLQLFSERLSRWWQPCDWRSENVNELLLCDIHTAGYVIPVPAVWWGVTKAIILLLGCWGTLKQAHCWSSSVHLQRSDSGHQHHHVGSQARVAALDVEELLHADVSAKARLRHCWAQSTGVETKRIVTESQL